MTKCRNIQRPTGCSLKEALAFYSMPEPNSGCQLWLGELTRGRGRLRVNGKKYLAHRLSWQAASGPIPAGLKVCHKCDVPACINPDHLFLGSQRDNVRDMDRKGRRAEQRGDGHPMAKLTAAQVVEIRRDSRFQRVIAIDYGVSEEHVGRIKRGEIWGHL